MPDARADCHPKVFISYSHDSEGHRERALGLAERLRGDGFETMIDHYAEGTPPEGWPRWMLNQIESADFVLVLCTEIYYRRFRGHDSPGVGRGADWEGAVITNELYDRKSVSSRFVPVLFEDVASPYIPEPLRAFTHYVLKSEEAYKNMVDHLAGAAGIQPAQLGPAPTRKRKTGTPIRFDERVPPEGGSTLPGRSTVSNSAAKARKLKVAKSAAPSNEHRLQVVLYAIIALVSFVVGAAVLGVMLWNAERLAALGLVGNLYYIVLIPLGLSAAAFLFGVLKSYARYRGKHLGGVLELGGPVIAFALVVLGGFFLVPSPQTFPLTVYVHGEGGPHDLVLKNSGHVLLDLGPDRRREQIGANGQAYFPAIPGAFRGQEVPVSVESDVYEQSGSRIARLEGSNLYLPVQRKGARIWGRVQDENGKALTGVEIEVAGLSAVTDKTGQFKISVPGQNVKPELELHARASGYQVENYSVVPGSNEIKILLRPAP